MNNTTSQNFNYLDSSIAQKNKIRFDTAMALAKTIKTGITTRKLFDYFGTVEPFASMSETNRMHHAGHAFSALKKSGKFNKPVKYKNKDDLRKCEHISLKTSNNKHTLTKTAKTVDETIIGTITIGEKLYWIVDPFNQ